MNRINKSTLIVLVAITAILLAVVITKTAIRSDKWLYFKINTQKKSDALVEKQVVSLDGIWLCASDDNKNNFLPEVDDSKWNNERFLYIRLLTNSKGKTWARKHFTAPKQITADTLILRLSLFDIQAQVYINGTLIADSGFIFNHTVCYKVPVNVLKKGEKNILAVHAAGMVADRNSGIMKFTDELIWVLKPTLNLEGIWKINKGDSGQWKEIVCNETNFKTIKVPDYWEANTFKEHDGFVWYRRNFICDKSLQEKEMVLVAGKIDDQNDVYINGKKIGGNINPNIQSKNSSEWNTWNVYRINSKLLNNTNTIAIRVFDGQSWGGIYQSPVGLMTIEDFFKFIDTEN